MVAPAAGPAMPLIDKYLDEIWLARGLSDNTLHAYRRDLCQLERALQGPLLGATDSDLLAVIAAWGECP